MIKAGAHTPHHTLTIPTAFHPRTSAACKTGKWLDWAGYLVADNYANTELEYFAVRNQCGVFDLSPMIKYQISGTDTLPYLNRLFTRDIAKIKNSRVAYVLFCNERGHTLDDGTLFRFSDSEYMFCTQDRHLPWLLDSALGFDVTIEDKTEKVAALALQGPVSCSVLKRMGLAGIEHLPPFEIMSVTYENGDLLVSRTGFTGDLGYELWVDPDQAIRLWDGLFRAGKEFGIVPFGSSALEILRIEAGYIMPHVDFMPANQVIRLNRGRSPLELGYKWLVDFEKGFFNGRQALVRELEYGSKYRLVGLDVAGNKPATDAWIYHRKRRRVGYVTSAVWSPTCKKNIAMALIEADADSRYLWADIYTQKELKWYRDMMRCRVVSRPFFNPSRKNRVPADEY